MLDLRVLPGEYVVYRLPAGSPLPAGLEGSVSGVTTVTWTADETSIVCPKEGVPDGVPIDTLWRCIQAGPVSLTQTGVLAALVAPLAEARVNIFASSTHDSDYLLIPTVRMPEARTALVNAGYSIVDG